MDPTVEHIERVRPSPSPSSVGQESRRRKSVFLEVGLGDEDSMRRERSPAPIPTLISDPSPTRLRPARCVRFRSQHDVLGENEVKPINEDDTWETEDEENCDSLGNMKMPSNPSMFTNSKMCRLGLLTLVLALMLPVLQSSPIGSKAPAHPRTTIEAEMIRRDDTNTQICKRWAHQSTVVNGTLYVYGGRATTDSTQTSNTWTNDFLTMDLTKSWQIANPSLTGLPIPSGPPAVSLGYLWNSHDSLFLYGGEFQDDPKTEPIAYSTWEYQIGAKQWVEHKDPKTSAGEHSADEGQPVQRSAEGSGVSVSTLGRGWYFGGHLDDFTTEGWSNQIERVYLKSLLEFTFPGQSNSQVDSLNDGKTASEEGVYRNVTEGGLQDTAGFPERADGLLLYIPGFSEQGLLVGLTGGVNTSFAQMNVIDVFDIATSTWYKQSTSGTQPKYRVNPCAVVAAAADGSSYNIYMFGGQNLQPYKEQIQYDDMWILSIPSFKWIEVDTSKQSVPYARAGHTCHIWDGQMIVIGGYVGQELSCDSPGIYVFNMSSLEWADQFTALTGDRALKAFDGSENSGNPLAQQANQRGFDAKAGLEGSYGYDVPVIVQSVIGGNKTGGATLTAPVQTPTGGPLASGKPITYTVTGPNGAVITETTTVPASSSGGGTNVGAIIAGTIAGVVAVIAAYFAFCAWVYRKQVAVWKNHAAMVTARGEKQDAAFAAAGGIVTSSSGKNSSDRAARDALFPPTDSSSAGGVRASDDDRFAYGGAGASRDGGGRRSSEGSVVDDLLSGNEPSFWGARGVLLNPRRSLRVINRD